MNIQITGKTTVYSLSTSREFCIWNNCGLTQFALPKPYPRDPMPVGIISPICVGGYMQRRLIPDKPAKFQFRRHNTSRNYKKNTLNGSFLHTEQAGSLK